MVSRAARRIVIRAAERHTTIIHCSLFTVHYSRFTIHLRAADSRPYGGTGERGRPRAGRRPLRGTGERGVEGAAPYGGRGMREGQAPPLRGTGETRGVEGAAPYGGTGERARPRAGRRPERVKNEK